MTSIVWRAQSVNLALATLSFDFVGTCLDESSEDLGTIQVPLRAACPVYGHLSRKQAFLQAVARPTLETNEIGKSVRLMVARR